MRLSSFLFFMTITRFPALLTLSLALAGPTFAQTPSTGEPDESTKRDMLTRYAERGPGSPEIKRAYLIAPDIIALTIEAQKVKQTTLEKYVPQEGDDKRLEHWPDGTQRRAILMRQGQDVGWLQGRNLDHFSPFEKLEGDPLLYFLIETPSNYKVTSLDDAKYSTAQEPAAVYRKSLPIDWLFPAMTGFSVRHTIYLKLKKPLTPGKKYVVNISELNVKDAEISLNYDSSKLRSDAVHVDQIGFRPDDPGKKAFLSTWLGTGGALVYPEGQRFRILNDETGEQVLEGPVHLRLSPEQTETIWDKDFRNNAKTAVYTMEFDGLKTPGRYRLEVVGIGCSYPFEIGPDVWKKAFQVQMRGLFHNRGGVELGPPYTTFVKPRDFHPADGASVTRSTYDALTNGSESYDEIAKGDTGEAVPEGWGGYHDAGDWNPRRATHLGVTMAQMELMELFPKFFSPLTLNIPPTPGAPDLLTEAMFEIDFFRRLQQPDGAVPFGIESQGDPLAGEVSWLSTQKAYVLAPNIRDTWLYCAAAARMGRLLKEIKPDLAETYLESARKAFDWAEADYQKRKADGSLATLREVWRATDGRNFSAILLYDITDEARYHEIFLEDTCLKDPYSGLYWYGKFMQADAAFFYARLPENKADPVIKKNAIAALGRMADTALAYAAGNAFDITQVDKYRPIFAGYFNTPIGGIDLVRAHYLTGKPEYLTGAVKSCLFGLGANPNNIVYTTGLGANPVKNPLHLDSRFSGQPAPEGFTVFGNFDYWHNKEQFFSWPLTFVSQPGAAYPLPTDWPLSEAYFDIAFFVAMNEYVMETWAPTVLVWGYLAARP